MGYLRKRDFLIFSDEGAPTKVKELDPKKVAEIEEAHQNGKKGRIEDLIVDTLTSFAEAEIRSEAWGRGERLDRSEVAARAADEGKKKAAGPEGERLRRILQRVLGVGGKRKSSRPTSRVIAS
ncbi:hypothetical protein [Streptomyces sp. NBC_00691]|uniref:hypothetical protein n=1 Tax=Streptomyces sp. NBC_00691 TaxID=2903671 RepID=UPI002E35AAEA|nr:hypothetical protein [Streptomyces sp. NBC_00691]